MASIGTFGSFTQARLAIYASQAGLQVTGNNIANINTNGYTRQKLDQTSFYSGGSDRYYSHYDVRVGNGVLTTGVSQLRDPYLDIRYREQIADVGAMDAKLAGLENIQRVLDEVGDGDDAFGVLEAQFSQVYDALMQLTDQTGHEIYDIQVRAACKALTDQFHSYAAQLESTYENAVTAFEQDVEKVNTILTNIRDLNETIRKAEIHGDKALELRDERNLLIDELAEFMEIDVIYTEEDIGAGQTVEKLTIKLADANPDKSVETDTATLVDGIYTTQLIIDETMPELNPDYDPTSTNVNSKSYYKYIAYNGNGTNNLTYANQVPNTNFNITLDALKDDKDRLMYTLKKGQEYTYQAPANFDGKATTAVDANGVITITTYRQNAQGDWIAQPYTKTPSTPVSLDDNDINGALQAQREMLTEEGEFASAATIAAVDENAASKRGIRYYQKALDLLARQFAEAMNAANAPKFSGYATYVDANGVERYSVTDGTTTGTTDCMLDEVRTYTAADGTTWTGTPDMVDLSGLHPDIQAQIKADQDQHLTKDGLGHGFPLTEGGNLFSNDGDGDNAGGITASNISIAHSWAIGDVQLVTTRLNDPNSDMYNPQASELELSTASDNILHMAYLFTQKMDYFPSDIGPVTGDVAMFNGTFQEMWTQIGATLGTDMLETETMLNTYYASSVQLDTSRMSVSSVDLNDEAMNLMQYSKSYDAACRLMTTIDSILDKLINGTGMTR